jgi:hypothetical protein
LDSPKHLRRGTAPKHVANDAVSIVQDYSTDESPETSPLPDLSALLGNRRSSIMSHKSSRSSLRRQSLDAIQVLAETQPQTLASHLMAVYGDSAEATDDVDAESDGRNSPTDVKLGRLSFYSLQSRASVLSGTASSRNSGFVPDEVRDELISPLTPSFPRRSNSLSRRTSNDRQIKQMAKLQNFFGSSDCLRPLLGKVFEDLEQETEQDDEATPDEKREFYDRSRQLRQSLLGGRMTVA